MRHMQQGFSLLELMIALSLFSFALLAAIQMQVQAHHMLSDAVLRSKALYLASSHKEILVSASAANPASALQQHWQTELNHHLPDVQFHLSETDAGMLMFFWSSQNSYAHCARQEKDCLSL